MVDMVCLREGLSETKAGALDILLDPVLANPDLRVRLQIDERRIDLVEDDALSPVDVLDGLQLAGERVARANLLPRTRCA